MKINLSSEEIKSLKSIMEKIRDVEEFGWIEHDGKMEPAQKYMEIKYRDGEVVKGFPEDYIGWVWALEAQVNQVVAYREIEDDRFQGE